MHTIELTDDLCLYRKVQAFTEVDPKIWTVV